MKMRSPNPLCQMDDKEGLAYRISWSVYQDNGRSIPLRSLGLRNLDTPSKSQPGLWLALGNSQKFLGNNQTYSSNIYLPSWDEEVLTPI